MSKYIVVGLSDEGMVQFDEGKNQFGPWSTDPGRAHIFTDLNICAILQMDAKEWAEGRADTLMREGGCKIAIAVDLQTYVAALEQVAA